MNIAIISIYSYIIFSLVFFILKHFLIDKELKEPTMTMELSWFSTYFVLAGFLIGLQNWFFSSRDECVPQFLTIFAHTIVPLILIMGTTMIFLVQMNWNRIFANTFGLWLASKINLGTSDEASLNMFYNDPNVLLQELETNDLFILENLKQKLNNLGIKGSISDQQHETIKQQYYTKQNVGYFIWLTFTGIVSSLISTNSILLQDCVIE